MTLTPLERFLAARLKGGSEWVGRSSNAMVLEAITGEPVRSSDYPSDLADLSRCCVTFSRAPWDLRRAMLPRLGDYCRHLQEKYAPEPEEVLKPATRRSRFLEWWRGQTRLSSFGARFNILEDET